MDKLSAELEKYGTVSASAGAVLRKPTEHFGFDLDLTPREIFERERIEASSRISNMQVFQSRVAVAFDLLSEANKAAAAGDALKAANLQGEANGILADSLVGAYEGGLAKGSLEKGEESKEEDPKGESGEEEEEGEGEEEPSTEDRTVPLPTAFTDLQKQEDLLKMDNFSETYKSREPDHLNLSLRQLIQLVFNDYITLKLFEWLSSPEPGSLGDNKVLFAVIMNVSCRPGRKTYKNYLAEIDVQVRYGRKEGNEIKMDELHYPLSFAVFPGLDSQVMDLRTGIRRQLILSLLLHAMWNKAELKTQQDLIRRLEHDVATVTGRNVVVGYNMSGRHFGWRFSPRMVAQEDPTDIETKPGNILEPQTFPALILILADKEDIDPEYWEDANHKTLKEQVCRLKDKIKDLRKRIQNESNINQKAMSLITLQLDTIGKQVDNLDIMKDLVLDDNEKRELSEKLEKITENLGSVKKEIKSYYKRRTRYRTNLDIFEEPGEDSEFACFDHFVFQFTPRWLRAPAPSVDRSWIPFRRTIHGWKTPRLGEKKVIDWAIRLQEVYDILFHQWPKGSEKIDYVLTALRKRFRILEAACLGCDHCASIPKSKPEPRVDKVKDTLEGWTNVKSRFVVTGRHFKDQVRGAIIGNRACHTEVVSDHTVFVTVEEWKVEEKENGTMYPLILVTTRGKKKVGQVRFRRKALVKPALKPFATLEDRWRLAGDWLTFKCDPPEAIPACYHSIKVLFRETGKTFEDWKEEKDARVKLDLKQKSLGVKLPNKNNFIKECPKKLDIDLLLLETPGDKAPKRIVKQIGTFVLFSDKAKLDLKLNTDTVTFSEEGKTSDRVEIAYEHGWNLLFSAFPDLEKRIKREKGSPPYLVLKKNDRIIELPLNFDGDVMYVKKEDLNKEREKLLPGITPEKGGNIDYENLKVMWGDKRLPITGNLKIDQEKKEKEKEKEKEESES